ncbi:hypothetical protein [Bartonella senegalensis]|uniref:hypothetical protein n=1 Tax=Bartonella senegalensis TaxID=1468418 RepID=UPI00030E71D2|nr:hypothetical protein [Bartonella senegalensis]
MSKIPDVLENMKPSPLMQKLNIYKPYLLIINSTDFVLIGNDEILGYVFYRQSSPSHTQIKSRLAIYPQCCKLHSKDTAIPLHDWKIKDLGAIKLPIDYSLKTAVLQQIDKTMMLVYMATLGDDSGVTPKISKPHEKTATWRNKHDLFMR